MEEEDSKGGERKAQHMDDSVAIDSEIEIKSQNFESSQ